MRKKLSTYIRTALPLLAILLMALPAYAKKEAQISFKEAVYDFGQVSIKKGKVTHKFEFTNTGDKNLTITNARADCGCTRPQYNDEPVAPGKSGSIMVTFVPNGKGTFQKKVTVTTNGAPRKVRLIIKGEVVP